MVRRSTDGDLSERDSKLLETLERWGWFVIKVGATGSEPAFAYSVGLYGHFNHPEIILFGLDLALMHRIINDAARRIQQGQRYEEGPRYDDLVEAYQCEVRRVSPRHYDGFLNYALWYYKSAQFPVLQLVWPDRTGLFPWDEGVDEAFRQKQPILS